MSKKNPNLVLSPPLLSALREPCGFHPGGVSFVIFIFYLGFYFKLYKLNKTNKKKRAKENHKLFRPKTKQPTHMHRLSINLVLQPEPESFRKQNNKIETVKNGPRKPLSACFRVRRIPRRLLGSNHRHTHTLRMANTGKKISTHLFFTLDLFFLFRYYSRFTPTLFCLYFFRGKRVGKVF